MQNPSSTCPRCQSPIPADAPGGLCPSCALLGVAEPTDPAQAAAAGTPTLEELAAAFPEYELLGVIGQGGMGVVFKARQPRLDRLVALKILPPALAAQPGFAERFTREARALARLAHPHIVAVYDFGERAGFYDLMMEFVNGVNLRQAMRAGVSPVQALALVPRICEALQFAHDHGVLHRDIKPENILLDTAGTPKLADFGIAKFAGDATAKTNLTETGAALGTAAYMSPEQIEKPATVDHRADIYSLGVVLYEMLTGELPLGRFAAPSEKSHVSPGVDEVVMRALEKERDKRQQSATEMKTQVEQAGVGSAPPVVPALAQRTSDRPWTRAGLALIALSAIGIPVSGMLNWSVPAPRHMVVLTIVSGLLLALAKGYEHSTLGPVKSRVAATSVENPWLRRVFLLAVLIVVLPVLAIALGLILPVIARDDANMSSGSLSIWPWLVALGGGGFFFLREMLRGRGTQPPAGVVWSPWPKRIFCALLSLPLLPVALLAFYFAASGPPRAASQRVIAQQAQLAAAMRGDQDEAIALAREHLAAVRVQLLGGAATGLEISAAERDLAIAEARGDARKIAEARLGHAEKRAGLIRERFKTGTESAAEMNEAEIALNAAKTELLQATPQPRIEPDALPRTTQP